MAYRVELDATRNALMATDCDKFRKRYKEKSTDLEVTFASPYMYTLEKNRFFLLRRSTTRVLESKYYYKPDYLSYDEYGTETLWYLLLFVNDIPSIEQFNKYEIIVPAFSTVLELAKEKVNDQIIVIGEDTTKVSSNLLKLYSSKIKPNTEPQPGGEPVADEEALYWIRQKFEVNAGQESAGYVDLAYPVIESTIQFKVEHGGNFLYNVDYKIITSFDSKFRRLTWRPENCGEGLGLLGSIKTGMMLEVIYAKKKEV